MVYSINHKKKLTTGNDALLLRVFCLGDSRVGKSSLLHKTGIAYGYRKIILDGHKIKLKISDIPGSSRSIIREDDVSMTDGILLFYDVTNRESFQNIRSWINFIQLHSNGSKNIILIGNKCDCLDSREVTYEEGEELAKEYGIAFLETSAKTGYNVDEAFMAIAFMAYHMNLKDPLHTACRINSVSTIAQLLNKKANPNKQNENLDTPLHIACNEAHVKSISLLIEKGAVDSIFMKNKDGKTPIDIAIEKELSMAINGKKDGIDYEDNVTPLEALIKGTYACSMPSKSLFSEKRITKLQKILRQHWERMNESLDHSHLNSFKSLLALANALQFDKKLSSVNIHFCGHGCSGKSTLALALKESLVHQSHWGMAMSSFASFIREGQKSQTVSDIDILTGRTIGLECSSFTHPTRDVCFNLFDYGGQQQFHVNHSNFLSMPESLHIIVVALWDFDKNDCMSDEEIITRYSYWLKYINSVSSNEHADVITLINFKNKADTKYPGTSDRIKQMLLKLQRDDWERDKKSTRGIAFHGEPVVLDVQKKIEVWKMVNPLVLTAMAKIKINVAPIPQAMNKVLISKRNGEWPLVAQVETFEKQFITDSNIRDIVEAIGVANEAWLKDKIIWPRLKSLGEILIVGSPPRWVVTDPNWLTSTVLGKIVSKLQKQGTFETFLLSEEEIDEFTEGGSANFNGDLTAIPELLEALGVCIPVTVTATKTTSATLRRWFPAFYGNGKTLTFDQVNDLMKEFCRLDSADTRVRSRRILRRFSLMDPKKQIFPLGYLAKLLADVAKLESSSRKIMYYSNGMEIERSYKDIGDDGKEIYPTIKVIILQENQNDSFLIVVMSRSPNSAPIIRSSYAWRRMESICNLIRTREITPQPRADTSDKPSGDIDDEVSISPSSSHAPSSWIQNIRVCEFCIDPSNTDDVRSVDEVERVIFEGASEEDKIQALPCFYGRDEHDNPVNEAKSYTFETKMTLEEKLDRLLENQEAQGRANVEAHQATHARLHVIGEDVAIIKQSVQSMFAQNISLDTRLQSLLALSSNIRDEGQNVREVMEQLCHSNENIRDMTNLIMEGSADIKLMLKLYHIENQDFANRVTNLLQQNNQSMQKLLEGNDVLKRMTLTLIKNTHNVTLVVAFPYTPKNLVKRAAHLTVRDHYRMLFVCSHTLQIVPCGPNGKGYKIEVPKEWVRRAAPVIKVGLIILRLALVSMTGVAIPIPIEFGGIDYFGNTDATLGCIDTALRSFDTNFDEALDAKEMSKRFLNELNRENEGKLEAYLAIKEVLLSMDKTMQYIGVEKVTNEAGETAWVKKDEEIIRSFQASRGNKLAFLTNEDTSSNHTLNADVSQSPIADSPPASIQSNILTGQLLQSQTDMLIELFDTFKGKLSEEINRACHKIEESNNTAIRAEMSEVRKEIEQQRLEIEKCSQLLREVFKQAMERFGEAMVSFVGQSNQQIKNNFDMLELIFKEKVDELCVSNAANFDALMQDQQQAQKMVQSTLDVHTSLLHTLIQNTHSVPTLVIIVPDVSSTQGLSLWNPKKLLTSFTHLSYRMFFICSHTLQVVPCGEDGKGYKIKVQKEWVRRAMPIIKVCLMIVKMAVQSTTGVHLPLPFAGDVDSNNLIEAALQSFDCATDMVEQEGSDDLMRPFLTSSLPQVPNPKPNPNHVNPRLEEEGTRQAYEIIKTLMQEKVKLHTTYSLKKITLTYHRTRQRHNIYSHFTHMCNSQIRKHTHTTYTGSFATILWHDSSNCR